MTRYVYNKYLGAELEAVGDYNSFGNWVHIYRNILPAFAKLLKRRIDNDLQNVIVVEGRTGSGKSTFAIDLALTLDRYWRIEDNYIYDVSDLQAKLVADRPSPISLFDEGSISLNSKNAMKGEDKMMVALFDTMRSRHWTTIICIPDLGSLNKSIREYHVDFLCKCPTTALIKGYDTRGFMEIYEHVYRSWGDPYYRIMGATLYPKLTRTMSDKYNRIKREHQDALIGKFINMESE